MTQNHLKKSLQSHINSKSLSDAQLKKLLDLQQQGSDKPIKAKPAQLRWVASFAVVFVVLASSLYINFNPVFDLEDRIGNEVAKNHIKLKPLEIETSSIGLIRQYFTELDFSLIESSLINQSRQTLIGGRYCSIQGITAAQLRLKDNKTGNVQSLYQTIYKPEVFKDIPLLEEGNKPITVFSKGLAVDIWVEKGLLFALTREVEKQDKPQN